MQFVNLFLILSLAVSCTKKSAPVPAAPVADSTAAPSTQTVSYLALGDSYTIGQSVGESERFPYLLGQRLADSGIRVGTLRYIARTGWTTDELAAAIASEAPPSNYDLVTLLIGVNDQYRGRDTASYAPRFTQLLQTAISLAGGRKSRVFVLSIPDYSATPFVPAADKPGVSRAIDDFNTVNRRITVSFGVSYTDITTLTRGAAGNPALLAGDGLHYSAIAHSGWADLLAPSVRAALR